MIGVIYEQRLHSVIKLQIGLETAVFSQIILVGTNILIQCVTLFLYFGNPLKYKKIKIEVFIKINDINNALSKMK